MSVYVILDLNILSTIIIGLFVVHGNAQSITGNRGPFKCINPTINNSQIPKCCNALNYKTWIVSIRERMYNWHLNIGVILHPRAVLTLADKINNVNTKDIVISHGGNNQDYRVSHVIQQPTHSTYLYSNFAILLLSSSIEFNSNVSNICWTNLSFGARRKAGIQYFDFLFHKESFQEPLGIISLKSHNRDIVINNRTVNMVFGKKKIENKQTYYFMGFKADLQYSTLKYKSGLGQVFNQFIWPNFQWINQILLENLNKTFMEQKDDGVKELKFKLHLSKNNTSHKYNVKIVDIKSDIKSDQLKISASQV
ncbi:uncharacterized protein [Chelonus insularis]|uniref:uncharacterized protein isoform X2 n=1 Tax=Chelonus insularis TaxID=460826 RepID=UPI00158D8FFC|nr:uncharacterized protein LOC118068124 isoform X2 [Chelonus insularis]